MSKHESGTRVFAVLSSNEQEINFLGFGTYVGDYPRPGTENGFSEKEYEEAEAAIKETDENPLDSVAIIQWEIDNGHTPADKFDERLAEVRKKQEERLARPIRERAHEILESMALNPKIELDNGDTVWGYQCWWGPEDKFEGWVGDRTVNHVRIGEFV